MGIESAPRKCLGERPEKNPGPERVGLVSRIEHNKKFRKRTGQGPENKKKERPREGCSHVKTGRDDWIRTSAPLFPKQVRYQTAHIPKCHDL